MTQPPLIMLCTDKRSMVPPRDFWLGNFCWPSGKKEARKKGKRGENWEEKKENCKREEREGGKLKMAGGKVWVTEWGEDPFFSLFFFTFQNHSNLFWVYQNAKFSTGKKHFTIFTPGKKSGKITLPPQKNFPVTPLILFSHKHAAVFSSREVECNRM